MHSSIAGLSLQLVKQKKYMVSMIAILLAGVATIAMAQEADLGFFSMTDAEWDEVKRYLRTFAYPRWGLAFAAMCIVPWLLALIGLPARYGAAISGKGPQMADHLRKVSILGSRYALNIYTGRVMSEKSWTETTIDTTTTTTVGGNWTSTGFWHDSMSSSTQVSVTTTTVQRDQVRIGYPDKSRGSWEFYNSDLIVAPGDITSLIARRVGDQLECVIGYNHDSRQFVTFNLLHTHAISGKLTWLVATVLGALGFSWGWSATMLEVIKDYGPQLGLPADFSATPMSTGIWITAFVIGAVVALVPLLIVAVLLPRIRTMIFKKNVMPGIRHFLEITTTEARTSFPLEWEGRVAPVSS